MINGMDENIMVEIMTKFAFNIRDAPNSKISIIEAIWDIPT